MPIIQKPLRNITARIAKRSSDCDIHHTGFTAKGMLYTNGETSEIINVRSILFDSNSFAPFAPFASSR